MLDRKDNNRIKRDSPTVANILNAISDDKSLALFNIIANHSSDFRISKANLTCKQYYSRISNLIKSDLISRKNKRYFLTSFGKIVYDAQDKPTVFSVSEIQLYEIIIFARLGERLY